MDDTNFSRDVAASWILSIESDAARKRVDTLYPRLNSWLEKVDAASVLDVGCGQGICAHFLDLKGRRYHGVDPSPNLIERAVELYAGADRQFSVANAYALPFPPDSFGAAFSVSVWHLLADLRTATSEVFRILSSGGQLLIVIANPDAYADWTQPYFDVITEGHRIEGSVRTASGAIERDTLYLRPASVIVEQLEQVGFIVGSVEAYSPRREGEPGMFLAIAARKV